MNVEEAVRETICGRNMISCGDNVIAGLSGGADSVCLLAVLHELAPELGFTLSAVHVNHCLRGEESDGDQRFCEELCRKLDIPLAVYRVDVNARVRDTGESTEEAARFLRYDAFERHSAGLAPYKIATAHNMCDNSETVLFNLARGTGIKGMCGIPYIRGNIIRPLLDVTRDSIEKYLHGKNMTYVTDSSNLSDDYSRNKIRHSAVPVLTEINSGFHEAVSRLSRCAEENEAYFAQLLKDASPEDAVSMPAPLRKRFIRKLLNENGISCSYDRLCELDDNIRMKKSTKYNLSRNIFAVFRSGVMSVECERDEVCSDFSSVLCFRDGFRISVPEFDKTVKITGVSSDIFRDGTIVHGKLTNNCVNCAKIQGVAVVRNKRSGDRIVLKGRDFSTKLKKLYNAMKLESNERLAALVIEDDAGLVWSEYGGVSDRACVRNGDDPGDVFEITVI